MVQIAEHVRVDGTVQWYTSNVQVPVVEAASVAVRRPMVCVSAVKAYLRTTICLRDAILVVLTECLELHLDGWCSREKRGLTVHGRAP
jgi:3-dehydroquinate dehydratase